MQLCKVNLKYLYHTKYFKTGTFLSAGFFVVKIIRFEFKKSLTDRQKIKYILTIKQKRLSLKCCSL